METEYAENQLSNICSCHGWKWQHADHMRHYIVKDSLNNTIWCDTIEEILGKFSSDSHKGKFPLVFIDGKLSEECAFCDSRTSELKCVYERCIYRKNRLGI